MGKETVEFVTKEEADQFVDDLFSGKPVEPIVSTRLPDLDSLDLGDQPVEFVSDQEVRDFIAGMFKSKNQD